MSKYRALWNGKLARVIEFIFDIVVLIVSFMVVTQVSHLISNKELLNWIELLVQNDGNSYPYLLSYIGVAGLFFIIYGTTVSKKKYTNVVMSVTLALFFTNLTLIVFTFLGGKAFPVVSSWWIPLIILIVQVFVFAVYKRLLYLLFFRYNKRKILIYGEKSEVISLAEKFYAENNKFNIIKYLLVEKEKCRININDVFTCIDEVDDVYITASADEDLKSQIMNYSLLVKYKNIFMVPKTYEITILDSKSNQVDDILVFEAKSMHLSFEQRFFKRLLDLTVSLIGLIVAFVPMIFVALAVKINDGGPIFYKQPRIKRNNKKFNVLKFRSMKVHKEGDYGKVATSGDSRITKIGKFIRATRLDELPQLINILKGEMSLVGPRPLMTSVIDEALKVNPEFVYRSNVKPGLTGLSQVYSRYDTTTNERLRYDLLYVRKYSFWQDIKILFQTVLVMFKKEAGLGRGELPSLEDMIEKKGQKIEKIDLGFKID